MKRIKIFVTALLVLFTIGCKEQTTINFINPSALPCKIIFNQHHYYKEGVLFFALQEDQFVYSKIVSYLVKAQQELETIFYIPFEEGRIDEIDINSHYLTFSILKKDGEAILQEIYLYNIEEKSRPKKIVSYSRDYNTIFPLHVTLSDEALFWIYQDNIENKSRVYVYDFEFKQSSLIVTNSFTTEGFGPSILFLAAHNGILFHDQMEDGRYRIGAYDLSEKKYQSWFPLPREHKINFKANYNKERGTLLLYGEAAEGDILYELDITTGFIQKYINFTNNARIYRDNIQLAWGGIYYPVQLQSLKIAPQFFFIEYYDFKSKTTTRQKGFDVVASTEYFATLSFTSSNFEDGVTFKLERQNKKAKFK